MKMLKLIVATVALIPSTAFAECYRNRDGSVWCTNANSTSPYGQAGPLPTYPQIQNNPQVGAVVNGGQAAMSCLGTIRGGGLAYTTCGLGSVPSCAVAGAYAVYSAYNCGTNIGQYQNNRRQIRGY